MKIEITEEKIKEIVKSYPDKIHCMPKANFEDQLTNHLKKCFGIKTKIKKKEDNQNVERRSKKR